MGRLLPLLPSADRWALALAPAVPLNLRGGVPAATYAPSRLPQASDDLLLRVGALYEADPQLAPLWSEALKTRQLAGDIGGNGGRNGGELGKLSASLLTPVDGARLMMIESGCWDTHSGQKGRLAAQLRGLDALLAALRTGLGPAWRGTLVLVLVLVATEFGRTAAINGTGSTDHGTASAAFLRDGALPRSRPVMAEWPGLAPSNLNENRDLKPTARMGDVAAAPLAADFALPVSQVAAVFTARA